MNDLSVLLAKASPFSCALASIFASQLKTMDLGNLPSLSYIIIFSTASFPSACKHADVFPTWKKEILSWPNFLHMFFAYSKSLWKNCPTAISSFSSISCLGAGME